MAYELKDESDNSLMHKLSMLNGSDKLDPFQYHVPDWSFYAMSIIVGLCPLVILCGVFTNIVAFVVLVRSRLWLKHEGYVYLAANFCANVGILLMCTFWMTSCYGTGHYYKTPSTSNVICKFRHFLMECIHAPVWLSVALLLNVYLRKHLIRCGCPMFAAKYCTLLATKNVVAFIFGFLFGSSLTHMAMYELQRGGECFLSPPGPLYRLYVAGLVEWIVMWVLPYVFLSIILLLIHTTARKDNKFKFPELEDRSVSADHEVLVLSTSLWCIIQASHFGLMFLHNDYVDNVVAYVVIGLVYNLSLGLQPILCFIFLKTLRVGFRSQLQTIQCCRRLFPSLDRDEEAVQLTSIQEGQKSTTESQVIELDLHICIELTSVSKGKPPLQCLSSPF